MIARSLLMILAVIACPAAARDRPQAKPTPKPLIASIDGLPLGEIPRQQLTMTKQGVIGLSKVQVVCEWAALGILVSISSIP